MSLIDHVKNKLARINRKLVYKIHSLEDLEDRAERHRDAIKAGRKEIKGLEAQLKEAEKPSPKTSKGDEDESDKTADPRREAEKPAQPLEKS